MDAVERGCEPVENLAGSHVVGRSYVISRGSCAALSDTVMRPVSMRCSQRSRRDAGWLEGAVPTRQVHVLDCYVMRASMKAIS